MERGYFVVGDVEMKRLRCIGRDRTGWGGGGGGVGGGGRFGLAQWLERWTGDPKVEG